MSETEPNPIPTRRRFRRIAAALGLAGLIVILMIGWAPFLLNTPAGNRLVAGRLARAFAPGRLRFASIRFSWTSPTRLADVALDDPSGHAVVEARTASLTPNLWGFVTRPSRLGTLNLEGASFDVERRADGSVDLAEALDGILRTPNPDLGLIIRADRASLTLRYPGLPDPIRSDRMDLLVHLRPSPGSTTVAIDLGEEGRPRLRISGESDRRFERSESALSPDFSMNLVADRWPIRARVGGVDLSCRLDGRLEARRTSGRLGLVIRSCWNDLHAGGPPLRGDAAGLTSVQLDGSLARTADGAWTVEGVEAKTLIGSIRADGRIIDVDGTPHLDIAGTIAPDFDAISKALASRVEPGAKLSGRPGEFRLKGTFRPDDPIISEARLQIDRADAFGLRLGSTAVVVRSDGRTIALDPIETTLNEGRLRLDPTIALDAGGGPLLRLGKGSSLAGARVNEEVSRRVLSYVAPIFSQTTQASGLVSLNLESAEFPIGREVRRKANATGSVIFHDVEFAPGPLARQIVAVVAPNKELGPLKLNAPVLLSIADGRINQRGLSIPIGNLTRVEIEGWVDFDKNLGLIASLPVTPALVGNNPLLGQIVAGTGVRVLIGGTFAAPELDKQAVNADLKDLGKDLLARGAGLGTLKLLDILTRPRDPNAPPPPTPSERKARRIERRNERRKARGLGPMSVPDAR